MRRCSGPGGTARYTRMSDASELSFTSEMNVFDSGGTGHPGGLREDDAGQRRAVRMPTVYPASHCPRGTERMAARITSAA